MINHVVYFGLYSALHKVLDKHDLVSVSRVMKMVFYNLGDFNDNKSVTSD